MTIKEMLGTRFLIGDKIDYHNFLELYLYYFDQQYKHNPNFLLRLFVA